MITDRFKTITDPFEAINLAEMDAVALMNRIDTKYVIHEDVFWRYSQNYNNIIRFWKLRG